MPFRILAGAALLIVGVLPATAEAQRTGDQARLIFTVSAGGVGGKQLWMVDRQPVQFTDSIDTPAGLSSSISSG